jgi:hypothetical protein
MRTTRVAAALATCLLLANGRARAQAQAQAPAESPSDTVKASDGEATDDDGWSFGLSATGYFVPDDVDYVQPTFTADRGMFHLELRHSYEALDSTSIWGGANFSMGETTTVDVTPMLGIVTGDTEGIAPGVELTVAHGRFELYSEAEYVFDREDHVDDFLYAWTEATWSATDWFRAGIAGQRTRAYQTDVEVERGLALGFTAGPVDFSAYVFGIDQDAQTVLLGVAWSF